MLPEPLEIGTITESTLIANGAATIQTGQPQSKRANHNPNRPTTIQTGQPQSTWYNHNPHGITTIAS